jgi:hypothetical protein
MNTAEKHTGCLSGEIQENTDLERQDELSFEEHCRLKEGGGLSTAHRIIQFPHLRFSLPYCSERLRVFRLCDVVTVTSTVTSTMTSADPRSQEMVKVREW